MVPDLTSVSMHAQFGAAVRAISMERAFQEVRWQGGTARNPLVKLSRKMSWFTEEFMEAITAYNDYVNAKEDGDITLADKPEALREIMHEVCQAVAVGTAMIEAHILRDPDFAEYIRSVRQEKLQALFG